MADLMERENQRSSVADVADRRRPGRVNHRNPYLIAILRQPLSYPESFGTASEDFHQEANSLTAAQGIAAAAIAGIVGWGAIATLLILIFLR